MSFEVFVALIVWVAFIGPAFVFFRWAPPRSSVGVDAVVAFFWPLMLAAMFLSTWWGFFTVLAREARK